MVNIRAAFCCNILCRRRLESWPRGILAAWDPGRRLATWPPPLGRWPLAAVAWSLGPGLGPGLGLGPGPGLGLGPGPGLGLGLGLGPGRLGTWPPLGHLDSRPPSLGRLAAMTPLLSL